MCSQFEAALLAIDDEIAELEAKLTNLRRRRNTMVPIGKLSVELITNILSDVVSDAVLETNGHCDYGSISSFRFFFWVSVTQFCSQWRNVALANSLLWTYLLTTNLRWFQEFLDRSKSRVLCIDTYLPLDDEGFPLINDFDYGEMIRLVIANMHRIHTLNLRAEDIKERLALLRNIPAPQMEVLRYSNCTQDTFVRHGSFTSPVNPNVMPRLREIDMSASPAFYASEEWNYLLPSHLPTVTRLNLRGMRSKHILEILDRCKAIEVLSTSIVNDESIKFNQPVLVVLPNLHHLGFDGLSWTIFDHLLIPSVRYMELRTRSIIKNPAKAFSILTNLLQSSLAPTHSIPRFLLSAWHWDLRIVVEVTTGETVMDLTLVDPLHGNGIRDCIVLDYLLRLVRTTNGTIQSLHLDNRDDDRYLLPELPYFFRNHVEISTIRLENSGAIKSFLSLTHAQQHICPSGTQGDRPFCDCDSCHTLRVMSYPGLQTLKLGPPLRSYYLMDFSHEDRKIWLDYLVDWLQERERQGLRLAELYITNCKNTEEVVAAVKEVVDNIVMDIGICSRRRGLS